MPNHPTLETFSRAVSTLMDLARTWRELFPQAPAAAEHWLRVLAEVEGHLREEYLRGAVVGTVKSGKSTLVNALVGQDLLRRGAGILTAMITRVQAGPTPQAVLRFKEWGEISEEIRRTLALIPGDMLQTRAGVFDLRRSADRELLSRILELGEKRNLWAGGSLNQEHLLLRSYLEGYEEVKDLLAEGPLLTLSGPELARHGDLVTREAAAVYLKDVLLTVPVPGLPESLELGDCQGSDSPIPQHLAQVLAYLVRCDLVLYVISSRVGLRQGDFHFLSELKRMGLLPHGYFLLNVDLAEHRQVEEIIALKARVRRELASLLPEPPLYAFSALELLLRRRREAGEALGPREEGLLAVWEADPPSLTFCQEEFHRFYRELLKGLERLRRERLAGGGFSQVEMVARGLREQVEAALTLSGQDLSALQHLEARLERARQPLLAARRSLAQALSGAGESLKHTLKGRVGSFLDSKSGEGAALLEFIQEYEPDWELLAPGKEEEALRPGLYRLFQEFQKELGRFVAGELTVRALEFVKGQEDWLRRELLATAAPLFLSLQEALGQYYREVGALGLPAQAPRLKVELPPSPSELTAPLFPLALPEDDWRLSGEAWLRSGLGWLRRTWEAFKARLGRKSLTDPKVLFRRQLEQALAAIKARLTEEARINLVDFGERLKFQYFFPLVDALTARLEAHLDKLLQSLCANLEGVALAMRQAGAEREARRQRLQDLARQVREVEETLTGGGSAPLRPAPPPPEGAVPETS